MFWCKFLSLAMSSCCRHSDNLVIHVLPSPRHQAADTLTVQLYMFWCRSSSLATSSCCRHSDNLAIHVLPSPRNQAADVLTIYLYTFGPRHVIKLQTHRQSSYTCSAFATSSCCRHVDSLTIHVLVQVFIFATSCCRHIDNLIIHVLVQSLTNPK